MWPPSESASIGCGTQQDIRGSSTPQQGALVTAVSDESSSSRRRGRPYRFPEDSSPLSRVHGGVDQRVAWLLGSSRIHGSDTAMAHRDQFVAALKDLGIAADQARVSRWESGSQRVPDRVVAAYEEVLGLAPSHLSAAINGLRRSLEPDSDKAEIVTTDPSRLHEDLDRLFAHVDAEEPHGSRWLQLTSYLATHPQIYMRDKSWKQLADSLILELGRSVGAAYYRRYEALRTLIRHPGAQRHVVKAIGKFVTDPAAQVVMHPLTLLQEVDHHKAGDLATRLLTTESGMLQQGAAWVTAAKVARRHYDDNSLKQLEAAVIMLLGAGPSSLPDVDLLDVAARLPEEARKRIMLAMRDTAVQARFEVLVRTGEILPQDVTRHVASRVAEAAQAATPPPYRIEPDMMLHRLVREALFHGHQERRHRAAVLLSVSPYSAGVAAACAHTIDHSDEVVALQAAMLLRYMATELQRDDLRRWAADDARLEVRGAALLTLGRLPQGIGADDESVILQALESSTKRPTQRASLYALGMGGSSALKDLKGNGGDFQRRAAHWWLRTGSAIHESATIDGQA
jgi:hypothetical protein